MAEQCYACFGEGSRCWQCGEVEGACECGVPNIGTCDECEGSGWIEEHEA